MWSGADEAARCSPSDTGFDSEADATQGGKSGALAVYAVQLHVATVGATESEEGPQWGKEDAKRVRSPNRNVECSLEGGKGRRETEKGVEECPSTEEKSNGSVIGYKKQSEEERSCVERSVYYGVFFRRASGTVLPKRVLLHTCTATPRTGSNSAS